MERRDSQPATVANGGLPVRTPVFWTADNCVFGQDDIVAAWVAKHLPEPYEVRPGPRAVGIVHDKKLAAGAIFEVHKVAPHVVHVAVAVTDARCLTKGTLGRWFWYPFRFVNCSQILTYYAASNDLARSFNRQIGMVSVARLPGAAYDQSDLIVNQMLRDECPWDWRRDPGCKASEN